MKIRYIFCNSKSEIPLKSMFKGLQTKVLYCIVDEEIFVHQGFKTIPVTMELFAEGMGIDLFEAQRIINNKVLFENLEYDKEVEGNIKVVDDVKDFTKTVTEKTKDTIDATKDTIDSTKGFCDGYV